MRRQCGAVIIIGSSEAMATARRSGAPAVAAGAAIVLAAAGAGARGSVVAATSFAPASGALPHALGLFLAGALAGPGPSRSLQESIRRPCPRPSRLLAITSKFRAHLRLRSVTVRRCLRAQECSL